MVCVIFSALFSVNLMPYLEILCCMLPKAINIKGDLARNQDILSNDKAPGDLIPQMQVLNLLENKIICLTLFYK